MTHIVVDLDLQFRLDNTLLTFMDNFSNNSVLSSFSPRLSPKLMGDQVINPIPRIKKYDYHYYKEQMNINFQVCKFIK